MEIRGTGTVGGAAGKGIAGVQAEFAQPYLILLELE